MEKRIAVAITLVLALAVVPAPAAGETPHEDGWTVVFTPDGIETVRRAALPAGGDFNQEECDGEAPASTYCTTLVHLASEVWSVFLTSSTVGTYTLEVRLFHATSVLVSQVNIWQGEFAGAQSYGTFPITPVFWHECFSYEFGTGGDDPMPLPLQENGTPGGTGLWACGVVYP